MPVNIELLGQWEENKPLRGYCKEDTQILTREKAINKIKRAYSKTAHLFNFSFLRKPNAKNFLQHGIVNDYFVQRFLGIDYRPNEDAINVIFTNNIGQRKIPMTAWIMAHRLGHSLFKSEEFREFRRYFANMMKIYASWFDVHVSAYNGFLYGSYIDLRSLEYAIGSMRSCRQRNLATDYEFCFELFAQYILTGKIVFNPIEERIIYKKRMAWGRPSYEYLRIKRDLKLDDLNIELKQDARYLEDLAEETLNNLTSLTLVM
jgi:hypothetical protein